MATEIKRVLLVRTEAVLQPQRVDLVDLQLLRVVEPSLQIGVVESQPETRHVQGIALLVVLKSMAAVLSTHLSVFTGVEATQVKFKDISNPQFI